MPGIIPLMVTGNLSRHQFQEIMRSVKTLLNKIETQKLATLPESSKSALDSNEIDSKSAQLNDELAFLSQPASGKPSDSKDPFSGGFDDIFSSLGQNEAVLPNL